MALADSLTLEAEELPQFLISTMNNRFDPAKARLDPSRCVVINQVDEQVQESAEVWAVNIRSKAGIVANIAERGLSKSRNRAIGAATNDICIIADDDLIFDTDAAERIQAAFDANPDADVITFQARNEQGLPLRSYATKPYKHSIWTASNVLSVEIAFRRSAILESKVTFDERFGLGAEFVSGEENIFVADLIKAGLSVMYFPSSILVHHGKTSGGEFQDDRVTVSKGAIFRRMYGMLSIPIIFAFVIKKSVTHQTGFLRMLLLALHGWRSFSKKK